VAFDYNKGKQQTVQCLEAPQGTNKFAGAHKIAPESSFSPFRSEFAQNGI
jgi:hypothetical protein